MENQNGILSSVSQETSGGAEANPSGKGGRGFRNKFLKFVLSLGGLIVFIFFVAAVSFWQQRNGARIPGIGTDGQIALSSKVLISSVGENAFGKLSDLASDSSRSADNGAYTTTQESSGTGEQVPDVAAMPAGGGVSDKIAVDGMAIYPYEPIYYTYVYEGGEFVQSEAKMNVLKRVTGSSGISSSAISGAIDFDLFDLNKLEKAETANISFSEDREYGYRTDIDLYNGSVSIYKNYTEWPDYYADCREADCYSKLALEVSDIPSDEEMTSAADAFLGEYQIDLSAYGKPEVDKQFMAYYSKEYSYVPDEISVVYPLVVDGKTVYESYGEVNGLRVNYDLRNRRVTGMYGLMTHNYQSSAYDAETDIAKILETATRNWYGDVMPLRAEDGTGAEYKKIKIGLDTPFLSYENMYRYKDNESAEYLVPCLVFPIKENPEAKTYSAKRVIVPLIRDFLENNDYPVAAMKGGAAGSTGVAVDGAGVSSSAAVSSEPARAE